MDEISPQTLRYVEQTPGFKEAVLNAKAGTSPSPAIVVPFARFHDDPLRLYACVLFASVHGVSVTLAP